MLAGCWPCLQLQHAADVESESVSEAHGFHFRKTSDEKLTQALVAADSVGKRGHFGPLFEKFLRLRLSHPFAETNALRRVVPLS